MRKICVILKIPEHTVLRLLQSLQNWFGVHNLVLSIHGWTNYEVLTLGHIWKYPQSRGGMRQVWPHLGYMCRAECVMGEQVNDKKNKLNQQRTIPPFDFTMAEKTDRMVCAGAGSGLVWSPGQRRLPPVPEPDHRNCWAGRAAVWHSAHLSACELPPAPPSVSCTNTKKLKLYLRFVWPAQWHPLLFILKSQWTVTV